MVNQDTLLQFLDIIVHVYIYNKMDTKFLVEYYLEWLSICDYFHKSILPLFVNRNIDLKGNLHFYSSEFTIMHIIILYWLISANTKWTLLSPILSVFNHWWLDGNAK